MANNTTTAPNNQPPEDLEWEEWDSTTSPLSFFHHCLAGSFAGVVEHTLLYPLDTVKTCWQSQVLGNSCGMVESCGVGQSVGRVVNSKGGGSVLSNGLLGRVMTKNETKASSSISTNNLKINTSNNTSQSSSQGIWSTMKNLMKQGHHLSSSSTSHTSNHPHGHSLNHQMSHAHVYTLAGNPPNVVDLTSNAESSTTSAVNKGLGNTISDKARTHNKSKRPWSKQSRAIRNATISDITAQGMIRSSASITALTDGGLAMAAAETTLNPSNNTTNTGFKRLWRGVQTMFVGCIPAHALYFSSYEMIKSMCTDGHTQHDDKGHHVGHDTLSTTQAMLAGGVATLLHDVVMTPMDTMKQRMQLGHYDNLRHAFVSIVQGDGTSVAAAPGEGWRGLYRSLPITVMTNVPYGMIMMTTNEWLRGVLEDRLYGIHPQNEAADNPFHFATILLSGMGAGTIASAATAPLDRVKTRLQTQRMGMVVPGMSSNSAVMEERALAKAQGKPQVCPKMAVQDVKRSLGFQSSSTTATPSSSISSTTTMASTIQKTPFNKTYYTTPLEAFQSIIQEEGVRGLFRGTLPRVALHAPSVAISWTAYEMAKDWLVWSQHH